MLGSALVLMMLTAPPGLRDVVDAYLKTEAARANVPSDWVRSMPTRFEQWAVEAQGSEAKLTYYPPGAVTETRRVWFELRAEKKSGAWTVRELVFVHAWARKSPAR